MKTIKLGNTVQDIVNGFKGVAVSKSEYLNGCIQYLVVPILNKENEPREGIEIDVQTLKVIGTTDVGAVPIVKAPVIELGRKVQDLVTGFKGIAVARTESLNGRIRYCVAPPVGKDNQLRDEIEFDVSTLRVVGVKNIITKKKPEEEPPGGPQRFSSAKSYF